ncbi:DNA-directed RNA polymerase subunit alpha [Candidatus Peribacteria bacterium RIFCSPHIGHO2_02_FULL_49_16]|nr:MAG: DNA-directed RNA polymerase subunit alpha [Candidatus Peribacteria bacterium RIFCSPHIGHO2_01_FULL_49_38]OGJ59724.1 MAG: DNA-directed RNA polymerase subunit alpha [Candidatus Peribacteria bacterium RIFCSPHIGHO2_02_FULL_49_16]
MGLPTFSATAAAGQGGDAHKIFVISPLPPGYGMTLGNALRRALLSSLPGAAVTALRMHGMQHEYSVMEGMKESVLDIMLNAKELCLKKHSKDPEVITMEAKGPKTITASDLKVSSDIEVLNPDLVLCTLDKGASVHMEFTVEKGVGYISANERNRKMNQPGLMYVDAVFSPVRRVRYHVEATRVGQRTDLEKLSMEVVTNGALTADEAVQFASQLLQSYFSYFGSEEKIEPEFMADFTRSKSDDEDVSRSGAGSSSSKESYTPIEILNLSPRTLNALINAGVGSIEQLTKCTETMLGNFRGFGAKALTEVRTTLAGRGLKLCDDASDN